MVQYMKQSCVIWNITKQLSFQTSIDKGSYLANSRSKNSYLYAYVDFRIANADFITECSICSFVCCVNNIFTYGLDYQQTRLSFWHICS